MFGFSEGLEQSRVVRGIWQESGRGLLQQCVPQSECAKEEEPSRIEFFALQLLSSGSNPMSCQEGVFQELSPQGSLL